MNKKQMFHTIRVRVVCVGGWDVGCLNFKTPKLLITVKRPLFGYPAQAELSRSDRAGSRAMNAA